MEINLDVFIIKDRRIAPEKEDKPNRSVVIDPLEKNRNRKIKV